MKRILKGDFIVNGDERRQKIMNLIQKSDVPVSGTALAKELDVSRQLIVQDIALLRASRHNIISTNRGYIVTSERSCKRVFKVCHTDAEIEDELITIVDHGGRVIDVFVEHRVYGQFKAPLPISSKRDILLFMKSLEHGEATPLKNVTSGFHYHTVEADSEEILDEIQEALAGRGYLLN